MMAADVNNVWYACCCRSVVLCSDESISGASAGYRSRKAADMMNVLLTDCPPPEQHPRVSVASHRRTSNRCNQRMLVTAFVTTQTSRPPDDLPIDIQQQQVSEPAAKIRGMSSLSLTSARADVGRSGATTALRLMANHTSPTRCRQGE
jgi:hypothetical protein